MAAPTTTATTTTLHELHQLLRIAPTPLTQGSLKAIRTVLLQKSDSITNLSLPPAASTATFSQLLRTALDPALSYPHRTLAVETLSAWLIRARTHATLLPPFPAALDQLCDVFLAYFDDATAGLAKPLKDLLANTLSLAGQLQVLLDVTRMLAKRGLAGVDVGEGKKGGYYALDAAVRKGVGTDWVFLCAGGAQKLVRELLENLVDRNLGPAIGKALVGILLAKRRELLLDDKEEWEWLGIWRGPVTEALRREDLRQRVVMYVLPGVLKPGPECFRILVMGLGLGEDGSAKGASDEDLGVLLCCLKVGKELGFVGEIGDESTATKRSRAPAVRLAPDLIAPLLGHAFPHIRVSAFNLVVQSTSITRPFTSGGFSLLKSVLPPLYTESDAEVRDQIIGTSRNMIERIAQSSYSCEKELKNLQQKLRAGNRPTPDDIRKMIQLDSRINDAKGFCSWYIAFLETLLQPGANYQRCAMSLRGLGMLVRSGVDASLADFAFTALPGNGSIASNGEPFKKGLFKWPEFSKEMRVFSPEIKKVLLEAMSNPFEDVRVMSSAVLQFETRWEKEELKVFLENGLRAMNESGRARDSDGVARTVALIFEIVKRGNITFEEGYEIWGTRIQGEGSGLGVLKWALDVIEREYLSVAMADFQRAVRERPVHGLFASIGMILESKDNVYTTTLSEADMQAWKVVHERIFRACEDIWRLTKAPLCFHSPEGHVPSDFDEEDEDMNTQTVMSYSWRAVKESSALLGIILGKAPVSTVNHTDFERGGKLLLQQLADIRHRGAFSAVSPSFVTLCTRCFKSEDATLQELPLEWLKRNLDSIMEKSNAITRRSAGLPYLIMGVLASEIDPDRPLLSSTFAHFVKIATLPAVASKNGERIDLPQVHALNCIKFLFTDARVSPVVVPYIGKGLELAVSCFGSDIWAIRNCGVMLFTALTNRLLGQRKSRNDYSGTFTTRSFSEKYAAARAVLLTNLRDKVGGLGGGEVESVEMVYPALSLIAKMEVDPGYEGMEEFRPLIIDCMSSRIWKVREMAARAYTALVGPKDVVDVITQLMSVGTSKQNVLHGNLCAVRALLERRVKQAVQEQIESGEVWRRTAEVFWGCFKELVITNRCAITKGAALQLLTTYAKSFLDNENLMHCIHAYLSNGTTILTALHSSSLVGCSLLKEQLVKFYLTYTLPNELPSTLQILLLNSDEEIILHTLDFTLSLPSLSPSQPLRDHLWKLASTHPWHQIVAKALTALQRLWVTSQCSPVEAAVAVDKLLEMHQHPTTEPIKNAALILLGPVVAVLPTYIPKLLHHIKHAAHEDQELPSRLSALHALAALAPAMRLQKGVDEMWISAYSLLWDLLNDDDDELRAVAGGLVCRHVLPEGTTLLLPLVAAETLALALPRYFPGSGRLLQEAVGRVMGNAGVEEAWRGAVSGERALFRREKRNLWVSVQWAVEVWGGVAEMVLAREVGDKEVVGRLRDWVERGRWLVQEMGGMGGVGGWERSEEVVVFLARVEVGGRVCGI